MCLTVHTRDMGCGKSKHRSIDDSDLEAKNNRNNKNSSSSSSNNAATGSSSTSGSSNSNSKGKNDTGQLGKRKKSSGTDGKNSSEKEVAKEEKSSPFRKLTNGRSSATKTRLGDRNNEISASMGGSASSKADGPEEKSNGATDGKAYTLEVPNEMPRHQQEAQSKSTCKDFKSLTSSKTVHITSSQIEFFKMLDEKIEKGGEYLTSGEVSEVSSMDETYRQ